VGLGAILSLIWNVGRGKPLPRPMESAQGSVLFTRDVIRGKPLSRSELSNARGFSLCKGCQQGETLLFLMGTRWVEVFLHITRVIKDLLKTLAHPQALPGNLVPVTIQVILFRWVLNLGAPTRLVGILGPHRGYLFWKC
jgi:hypothetical protein